MTGTGTTESETQQSGLRGRLAAAAPALAAVRFISVAAFRADPLRAVLLLVLALASTSLFSFGGLWVKLLVDAVAAGDRRAFAGATIALSVVVYAGLLMNMQQILLQYRVAETTSMYMDLEFLRISTGLPGIEHHERPDLLDKVQLLRSEKDVIGGSVHAVVNMLQVCTMLLTTAGLLAIINPVLLLLLPAGLPLLLVAPRGQRRMNRIMKALAEPTRLRDAFHLLAIQPESGKEFRVFGLREYLVRRQDELSAAVETPYRSGTTRNIVDGAAAQLFYSIAAVAAIAFVALRAASGRATAGDVALAATVGGQVQGVMSTTGGMFGWLTACVQAIGRFTWLRGYAAEKAGLAAGTRRAPESLTDGIRLRDLTFRYPGTDVDVLSKVDLHLPAGATIAVVGDNGAGKSTLVKLLSRFYDPTEGRIEIDGVDLRELDLSSWRSRMSGAFQDVLQTEFTARDTVGIGLLADRENDAAVHAAVERAAATDVVDQLPNGLQTQLGREFDDGTDLSGGQWQKLGLARAMMRPAPLLLVLDEPTAALDAGTEHALFERYAGAARTAGALTGAITLLVSHRFSTVRMADLIIVIEGGGVTQVGTHAELMARGGTYAELYEMQARLYR